jgi:hypothetical protein
MSLFASLTFAYGTQISDLQSAYRSWVVLEEFIPIWIGTDCVSNLFQNYMIAGQYIGFHECSTFAYQEEWFYPYSQYTSAGSSRKYYKGSTSLGSTSMPYDDNVLVADDLIWDNHSGNTNGNILGEGYDTYYAKSQSSFICIDAIYPTQLINNSVSMIVSQKAV